MLKRFPLHLDAVPLEDYASDEDLADAERAVDAEISSPLKRFMLTRRRYVGGSQAAGAWAAELCYDGAGGLYVDGLDPRCVRWADGFLEPHAPRNPWMITVSRMPVEQVKRRKKWNVPDDLNGDDVGTTLAGGWASPLLDSNGLPRTSTTDKPLVTVVKYRCRFEDYGAAKPKTAARELDPAVWHLACPACGWRSPGQSEAMQTYPEHIPSGCPTCGGDVGLVKRTHDSGGAAGDKRMVICAPFSGHEEPFYEGPWEFDYPTFPVLYLESYTLPHRSGGQSDTQVLKTPVLASNAILRLSYETALRSRPYFFSMRGAIENARGGVFGFDPDADGDLMYGTGEIPRPPIVIQGAGINPSVFPLYDRVQSVFRTNESTSETALSPQQIAQANVGTIEQVTETGNVVVDDHGQTLYDAEGLLLTCMAAALRELPSKKQRYQDENGQWQFRNLGGPLMPRVEMRAGASQLLDTLDMDELKAYGTLIGMDPRHRRGFARFSHIPPDVLGQIEADESAAGPAPVVNAPMGAGGAPPIQPPMIPAGGLNG